jgi:uncharacterized protein
MFGRLVNPLKNNSFFLFGARGTGKTSLLKSLLAGRDVLFIDLLNAADEYRFNRDPNQLEQIISERKVAPEWVVIDEVQKAPKLLDVVHKLIESDGQKFALTGSSARKLKRGGANLLAGRAFLFHLFPFTHLELGDQFRLDEALLWGSIPRILTFDNDESRELFLNGYVEVYLKEEIVAEQLVRNAPPFRAFLEVAAQINGEIINYAKIAREIHVDDETVKTYFDILEDTLIGTRLLSYDRSVRKQQIQAPKFYLFDCGVKRALERFAIRSFPQGSSHRGDAFEHFIILEFIRLNSYLRKNFKYFYLKTKDGLEIDLIVDRPGEAPLLVEIKSTREVQSEHCRSLRAILPDIKDAEAWVICDEERPRNIEGVHILPWREAFQRLFVVELNGIKK